MPHRVVANWGPDLQKILRLSYDKIYLKTVLSHTYDMV